MASVDCIDIDQFFHGTATIGERGQIVIPADARKFCNMNPGDKLLVFRHPLHPHILMLSKVGEMQQMLQQVSRALENLASTLPQELPESE